MDLNNEPIDAIQHAGPMVAATDAGARDRIVKIAGSGHGCLFLSARQIRRRHGRFHHRIIVPATDRTPPVGDGPNHGLRSPCQRDAKQRS